jgi:hypothetical protein
MIFLKTYPNYNVKKCRLKTLSFDFTVDSITYSRCRDTVLNKLGKIKSININSTRRPEHKKVLAKDFYDANKNKSIIKYLNKQRNYEIKFRLYEQCFEILALNDIKLNSFNLACELGCGSMKQNMAIYKHLNEKYYKKPILWFGIDVSKFMLEYNNDCLVQQNNLFETEEPDEYNYFEYICSDLKYINSYKENVSFDLCLSVSMLQWMSHSRLNSDEVTQNLTSLFEFLCKFLSGVAIFHFYPDGVKNLTNILDILNLPYFRSKLNFILYRIPQCDNSLKWFLFLKKI